MTVDQTRQLGIEFERRVQLIDPRLISLEKVGQYLFIYMQFQDVLRYLQINL